MPEVTYASSLLGRADFGIQVICADNDALWDVVRRVRAITGVRETETAEMRSTFTYRDAAGPEGHWQAKAPDGGSRSRRRRRFAPLETGPGARVTDVPTALGDGRHVQKLSALVCKDHPHGAAHLVRHGETDWNRENRWWGQYDRPLSAPVEPAAPPPGDWLASG
jgi:hypothetical protein